LRRTFTTRFSADDVPEDLGIPTPVQKSLILRLQVHPELLAILNETIDVRQELYIPGDAADELRGSPNVYHHERQPTPLSYSRPRSISARPPLVQCSDRDDEDGIPLQARRRNAIILPRKIHETEANGNENEKENSPVFSDVCQLSSPKAVADRIDADADLPMEEIIHHTARQSSSPPAHDGKIELPSLPSDSDATDVSRVREFVTQKNTPFLIVSSDDIEATRSSPTAVQLPMRSAATAQHPRDSDIIDLCSDDEDSIMGGSFKADIDGTPDFEDELRWPSQKRKRGGMQEVSDDGSDDVLEEADGDAWRRASLK
jgi:hypothetical protein